MTSHAEERGEEDGILELDQFSAYCPGCKGTAGNPFQKEVLKRALNAKKKNCFSYTICHPACFRCLSPCPSPRHPCPAQRLASSIQTGLPLGSVPANIAATAPGARGG